MGGNSVPTCTNVLIYILCQKCRLNCFNRHFCAVTGESSYGTQYFFRYHAAIGQVGCGGDPKKNRYLEVSVVASVDDAADMIRASASKAGGLVEVARNPVDYQYLERSSAIDCYSLAEAIGREFNARTQIEEKLKCVCAVVKGDIIAEGMVGPQSQCFVVCSLQRKNENSDT